MKIYIDPGHGGNDPGAIGLNGTKESEVVLKIALKLKDILRAQKFDVEMTRCDNTGVSLVERAQAANRAAADLFVSIHCNGFANSTAAGTEVYSYPGDGEGHKLSEIILNGICSGIGTKKRGAKTENFAVLRLTEMPAILIETAFITNPEEEKIMQQENFAGKMAQIIADGICSYIGIKDNSQKSETRHWGEEYLQKLISMGYINSPEMWKELEKSPTNAMVLALISKIAEGK